MPAAPDNPEDLSCAEQRKLLQNIYSTSYTELRNLANVKTICEIAARYHDASASAALSVHDVAGKNPEAVMEARVLQELRSMGF